MYIINVPSGTACNVKGSSGCPKTKSWIKYWKHHVKWTYTDNPICSILDCPYISTDGAHVTIYGVQGTYIIPTCHDHNPPNSDSCESTKDVYAVWTDCPTSFTAITSPTLSLISPPPPASINCPFCGSNYYSDDAIDGSCPVCHDDP